MSESQNNNRVVYGRWPSPLDTADVFARPGVPAWPERHEGYVYWIRSLPREGGRLVLVRIDSNGYEERITPDGFNIRTRVHEYGGRCHVLFGNSVYFTNYTDQLLYRQELALNSRPECLTDSADGQWRLADFTVHPSGKWLVAVGEREVSGEENENALIGLALESGSSRPLVVVSGADFYASPQFSPDGRHLAWIRWTHPNMPWDDTALHEAAIDANGPRITLGRIRRVAGGAGQCVCQAVYDFQGALVYARDSDPAPGGGAAADMVSDFWNLYRNDAGHETALTRIHAEAGYPAWVFGYARVRACNDGRVLAVVTGRDGNELGVANRGQWQRIPRSSAYVGFSQLSPEIDHEILLVADTANRGAVVLSVDTRRMTTAEIWSSSSILAADDVSEARAITCRTRDGAETHGWLYQPKNSAVTPPADTRPPLMVLIHGGPTGRAEAGFDPMRQFWTTRGFAVLDVNHRGSTGYGRRYRNALKGNWGVIDVDDAVDLVQFLADAGQIDPALVFIRGGSAGGYSVLSALTRYPDLFCAGACYYGIGNLVTLVRTTHKFESRYTDALLGEPWQAELEGRTDTVYFTRSPINAIDRIKSPMILFQGDQDKVVPPEVSREVSAALKKAGLTYRYIEYEGEGHGFRRAENRIDALEQEAAFFAGIMNAR